MSYLIGRWAEDTALEYLSARGMRFIARNFRSTFGEIDLIMQDKDMICFVEVRYRENDDFYTAIESISQSKQDRIILASHQYLADNRCAQHLDCRFDVVALAGKQKCPTIQWLKNAFQT